MRKRGAAIDSSTDACRVVNFTATSGLVARTTSRTAPISDSGSTLVRITTCTRVAA